MLPKCQLSKGNFQQQNFVVNCKKKFLYMQIKLDNNFSGRISFVKSKNLNEIAIKLKKICK